jgi:hypothetical protein
MPTARQRSLSATLPDASRVSAPSSQAKQDATRAASLRRRDPTRPMGYAGGAITACQRSSTHAAVAQPYGGPGRSAE